jgi:hypothetical protein
VNTNLNALIIRAFSSLHHLKFIHLLLKVKLRDHAPVQAGITPKFL